MDKTLYVTFYMIFQTHILKVFAPTILKLITTETKRKNEQIVLKSLSLLLWIKKALSGNTEFSMAK